MASISTAIIAVLSADQASQTQLGFIPGTPDQIGIVSGSTATVLFVAATLAIVYAQAVNYGDVPKEDLDSWMTGRVDRQERIDEWERIGETAYRWTRFFWINGLSLFFLTLGILAYGKVPPELPVAAAVAMVPALLNVVDDEFRRLGFVIVSLIIVLISGVVAAAAAWAIWSLHNDPTAKQYRMRRTAQRPSWGDLLLPSQYCQPGSPAGRSYWRAGW